MPQLRAGLGGGSAPGSSSLKRLHTALSPTALFPVLASESGKGCPENPNHQPASAEMKRAERVRPDRKKVIGSEKCFIYLVLELHVEEEDPSWCAAAIKLPRPTFPGCPKAQPQRAVTLAQSLGPVPI